LSKAFTIGSNGVLLLWKCSTEPEYIEPRKKPKDDEEEEEEADESATVVKYKKEAKYVHYCSPLRLILNDILNLFA
jgi:hypothetical protein